MNSKKDNLREIIIVAFVALVFTVFGLNLFRIQVVNAKTRDERTVASASVKVEAERGEIYDRNGKLLVTNSQSNLLVFEYNFFPSPKEMEERIKIIDALIKLFEENDVEWRDELPIKIKSSKAAFKKDSDTAIAYLKSKDFLNLNEYATAENCMDALIERYALEGYSKKRARKIASVCYLMKRELFSASVPTYVFAEDVPGELIATVKENSEFYKGVDVKIVSEREYIDGTIAPHIIGSVGAINAEEYAEKKDQGYGYTSFIGKSGIEKAFESYLKGNDGEKVVVVNSDGEKETIYTKEPEKGNSVILTIDSDIQKVAQDALDNEVNVILKDKRNYQLTGACVVQEVATGDVIASATYPSYDLSTYWENAAKLNNDELAPLWNRAFQSIYTPGSTMKLAVSMAGLEEGVIANQFRVTCTGRYTYYKDYQPRCLGVHGQQNVVNALYNSCNCYFYEVSRLLGIEKLNEYCAMFGLGTKTGIEISESEGKLDSVAARNALGEQWTPGLTLQAGIGHGNNMFTPIQLCSYVATVASEGTRRKASLVKSVRSADFSQVIYETPSEVLSQANFSASSWSLVKQGMRLVGDHYFTKAVVPVCAKTGTTTVTKTIRGKSVETNNGILVCFAPADDPKIAISIVIEGAGSGGSTAPVAVDIINAYFGTGESEGPTQQDYNELL